MSTKVDTPPFTYTSTGKHPLLQWLFTTDHKKIGMMYLYTSLFFFFVGGLFAMVIRAQLLQAAGGVVSEDFFNQMMTMHGTVMIFLWIMPALVGFGNYVLPLVIGARDVAFPRMNAIGFWLLVAGGLMMMASFAIEGGANTAGWTIYPPLSAQVRGIDFWILGVHVLGASSIMGGLNFIVTILNMRAPGMTLHKMPLFAWTWLVTAWLQVIATPALAGVITMLLADRNFGTSFFNPAQGGDPVLFQHLFWFYSHPAVYIMILPAMGMVSEIIAAFSGKKFFGYRAMAYASVAIGVLGLMVWAHHMFSTGIDPRVRAVFMFLTMLIAIPTGIKIFSWIATMWGGVLRFTTPMLFAVAFVAFFLIGGLSGVFLASIPVDILLTDTYFVVAHIHYVLFSGSVLGILGGFYYWFPKMTGRMYNERLGKIHFWITVISMNVTFFPMHFLGTLGMPRRIATYAPEFQDLNQLVSYGAFVLGAAQLLFVYNILVSRSKGKPAGSNPWQAPSLEWTIPSPPPLHNFDHVPEVK